MSTGVLAASHPLPEPTAGLTLPIGIVLVVLALVFVLRKLISLALLAVVVAVVVFAYQGGAFDRWVDDDQVERSVDIGKKVVGQNALPGG